LYWTCSSLLNCSCEIILKCLLAFFLLLLFYFIFVKFFSKVDQWNFFYFIFLDWSSQNKWSVTRILGGSNPDWILKKGAPGAWLWHHHYLTDKGPLSCDTSGRSNLLAHLLSATDRTNISSTKPKAQRPGTVSYVSRFDCLLGRNSDKDNRPRAQSTV
jgi:hypothetical protein